MYSIHSIYSTYSIEYIEYIYLALHFGDLKFSRFDLRKRVSKSTTVTQCLCNGQVSGYAMVTQWSSGYVL